MHGVRVLGGGGQRSRQGSCRVAGSYGTRADLPTCRGVVCTACSGAIYYVQPVISVLPVLPALSAFSPLYTPPLPN